ncbi:14841_t:CDS:2, partial [Gigaspora rosea]
MVLVQDENEVQEVLPATLALESGEGYDVEESSHQGLKKAGIKRDLVERLAGRVVSKSKRKERIDDNGQVNNVWERM